MLLNVSLLFFYIFLAHCKCGSKLTCNFCESTDFKNVVFKCNIKWQKGNSKCGKIPLREPIRSKVCQTLSTQSVERFRVEQATKHTLPNGKESALLYTPSVLSTAKNSAKLASYLDKDAIIALFKMKFGIHIHSIQDIGYHPFFVRYLTNNQLNAVRRFRSQFQKLRGCIDSTGRLVQPIRYPISLPSKHTFMHAFSLKCEAGQMMVSQMLSIESTTREYINWLNANIQLGFPVFDEIVSDYSRAILTAVVKVYSKCKSIEEYADLLREEELQTTKIAIDIAHFMKKYAIFFKNLGRKLKTFYMCLIGHLTQCTSEEEAEILIKKIFIVSQAETEGHLPDGTQTQCLKAIISLEAEITGMFLIKFF